MYVTNAVRFVCCRIAYSALFVVVYDYSVSLVLKIAVSCNYRVLCFLTVFYVLIFLLLIFGL